MVKVILRECMCMIFILVQYFIDLNSVDIFFFIVKVQFTGQGGAHKPHGRDKSMLSVGSYLV